MGRAPLALLCDLFGSCWLGFRFDFVLCGHSGFETPDALSQALAEFGKFLRAQYQQSKCEYDDDVHRLKQSFKQWILLSAD